MLFFRIGNCYERQVFYWSCCTSIALPLFSTKAFPVSSSLLFSQDFRRSGSFLFWWFCMIYPPFTVNSQVYTFWIEIPIWLEVILDSNVLLVKLKGWRCFGTFLKIVHWLWTSLLPKASFPLDIFQVKKIISLSSQIVTFTRLESLLIVVKTSRPDEESSCFSSSTRRKGLFPLGKCLRNRTQFLSTSRRSTA